MTDLNSNFDAFSSIAKAFVSALAHENPSEAQLKALKRKNGLIVSIAKEMLKADLAAVIAEDANERYPREKLEVRPDFFDYAIEICVVFIKTLITKDGKDQARVLTISQNPEAIAIFVRKMLDSALVPHYA
jgi:hypothetical protein